jgi:hypothetical protein
VSATTAQALLEWEDANPLLKGVPCDFTFESVHEALSYDPSQEWDRDSVQLAQMRRLTHRVKHVFVATRFCVDFSIKFLENLVTGLIERDPRKTDNKARLYVTGAFKGRDWTSVPWFPSSAGGMVLEGITGVSKTHTVERVLRLLPHQVIEHEGSQEYGWKELKQLLYLVVPMPSTARIGPFLLAVALQMDKVLGTSYTPELTKRSGLSDDKRAVLVLHWLTVHRCGYLIVEECQERNLHSEVLSLDFLTFFLRALNWGVPVCLIGNPKALSSIRSHVQDGRRFSMGHWFTAEPAWHPMSDVWAKDLVPSLWGWSPCSEPDDAIPNLEALLWRRTGGVPGFLAQLRKEALDVAISDGRKSVNREDIEKGFRGRGMAANHRLIDALVRRDAGALSTLTDVPASQILDRWKELQLVRPQGASGNGHQPQGRKAPAHGQSKQADDPGSSKTEPVVNPAPPIDLPPQPKADSSSTQRSTTTASASNAELPSSREAPPPEYSSSEQATDRRSVGKR